MTESINQTQAAAFTGLSTRRLQQLDRGGEGPARAPDGRYPCAVLGEWFRARIAEEYGVANDGQAYDYNAERARLTKAQADKTELEVRELRAELIRTVVVEQHWQEMVAGMRGKLLSLPSRIAAQVAGPDRLQEVQEKAQTLVYEALDEIAGGGVPADVQARAQLSAEVLP